MIAEAEIKEKDEKYNEMMKKHRTDEENILEKYEAQSVQDNNKINQQEIEISQHEQMAKKANRFFTKRMREENDLRTKAEKVILEKQAMINEQESKIKSQAKELRVWKKWSKLFWGKEPESLYNPNEPDMAPTPRNSVETDNYEDDSVTSIEPIDTTTASIYGDTSVQMDSVQIEDVNTEQSQERDPSPSPETQDRDPSPNPELGAKKKKDK